MDFGLDNEFESDDSFFDDPKATKKAKTAEKKSLEDIFGFQDDKKPLEKTGPSSLENAEKPKVRFNIETPTPNEKPDKPSDSSKTKTLDWLGGSEGLDFLKKDPVPSKTDPLDDALAKSDSKKAFDLLDDILPQRGNKKSDQAKTTSFEDILRDSKAQKSGPGSLEKSGVEQKSGPGSLDISAAKRNPSEGLSMILEPPQGSRRGRRGSNAGVTDVLGLFGSGPSSSEFIAKTTTSEEKSLKKDVPDWLGGSSTTLNKSETSISQPKPEQKELQQPQPPRQEPLEATVPNVPQVSSFQTNMSNLQTQESFLLVSLQLKKYEESLSDIKNQQQEILRKQEKQFDTFLNQYIEKQKGIEQEMLSQQERINEHISILALKSDRRLVKEEVADENDNNADNVAKFVQSLKQRHDEEFFLMEESYKKQISLLEKSSEQLEHRLNQETDKTLKLYEEKLETLKTQHAEEIQYWTDKIKIIDEKHREEMENAKENHNRAIREAKDEFLDQIERFKEQRTRENELLGGSADFSQKLNSSLEKLNENEKILAHIQGKVVSDYSILSAARERSLETKEKDISAMRVALEKCREQAEKDRSQLLALVGTLELKISEQNRNAQEERWALQQAAATIAARSVAFDREIEFSRASIEREREQLKTLKESLLAEQEMVALELTEQKLKLSAEKSRLEVSAKLVNNYEVEKIKTEAETAIQVAKELTEKLNLERSFVQRQKLELEGIRNRLMERERDLLEREENVEEMRREAQQKTMEDRRLIQDTKHLEIRYKEKLSEIQSQAISLSNREKKLAEEKLLVSKEKLALYTATKAQGGHKKCMLCKAEEDRYLGHSATEPELIKLRMDAIEDELNSEVSREDNN